MTTSIPLAPRRWVTNILFLLVFCCSAANADPLLNGVAVHQELGKDQFIAGLFTSTLSSSANAILLANEDKRLQIRVMAQQLSNRRFKRMWIEGIAINSSQAELQTQARNVAAFNNMLKVKMIAGDIFSVDRRFDRVTVAVNGVKLGEIDDPKFFDLLLRTWIGPVPLSSEFRQQLLVQGEISESDRLVFENTKPVDTRIAAIEQAFSALPQATEASVALPQSPDIATPSVSRSQSAAVRPGIERAAPAADTQVAIAAPKVDAPKVAVQRPKVQPKPSPSPKPQQIALAPRQEALDESIFDISDEEEFTAESLLKEQLYYSQLAKYTHRFIQYPPRAWDKGREGYVRLRVTIDRNGKVKDTEILNAAEYKSLNREAAKAVQRANPYPAMPDEIKGDEYSFTFRVAFKIARR